MTSHLLNTHLHQEIEGLKTLLLRMADTVNRMFHNAMQAIVDKDLDLAQTVIQTDRLLDEMEIEVDETVIRLFACHQPMAVDLRFILNASKMSGTLERMGDQACNIAKCVRELKNDPIQGELGEIVSMARESVGMIQDALRSFVESNAHLAREVCRRDDKVDRFRDQIFARLVAQMQHSPEKVHANVSLILITRNLERLGDLATNIGEDVVNLVEGVIIKHHHGQPPSPRQ